MRGHACGRIGEGAVVPLGAVLPAREAAPHGESAQRLMDEAGDVGLLARPPCGLGLFMRIGAIGDNRRDGFAKARADRGELGEAALVLDRMVEQSGNRVVLVGPVLERDRGATA